MNRNRSSHPKNREVRCSRTAPALGLGIVLTLAACGGDADVPQNTPSALSSSSTTGSPTEDAAAETEATTEEPTGASESQDAESRDEDEQDEGAGEEPGTWATFTEEPPPIAGGAADVADDPRAQAVTAFNEELARAATADQTDRPEWLATLNEDSLEALLDNFGDEFGRTYPGPLPFEALAVDDLDDGTASVQGCMVTDGFSVGPVGEGEGMTGIVVSSIEYSLVEDPGDEGAWLVDAIFAGAYDCSSISVEARTW